MQRICFQLQVKPDRLAEYEQRHVSVWPSMLKAIEASGRRNYSIFLREDGLLIGYYEVDDDEASKRALAANPETAKWEAEAAGFFEALPGGRPDQNATTLREVFNLQEQLSRLSQAG
ncbi:L-rhamnose mutarotase [Naasia lichenicola]|uniref:L-rhamnose mutarotase n=1 Tax=Naasia lichenicola TaxID=2565933 RepID=A0A4S4FLU9_9MICO|nr:L-rhamnose mutarotase [Naasia lichenicola]THG30186.1 L-rhamnose mutarotase [Naasia lichenicola]